MLETFGARLRQRREVQQVDLIAIAEQTKIKLSLLEALERDDVSHWPSGISGRAFIRAYASAIDLDPDAVVREFLEVHREPGELPAAVPPGASAADSARTGAGPPTRLAFIVGSAIGSLARLRRIPAVENRVDAVEPMDEDVAHRARVPVPRPAGFGVQGASPSPELEHVGLTNEIVADGTPKNGPGSSDLDVLAAAQPTPDPDHVGSLSAIAAARAPASHPALPGPDLLAVARLCTEFARVEHTDQVPPLVQEAAGILGATGLIVWVWDATAAELRPALVHGYSDSVLAHLPAVTRDADNATAAAFRSSETSVIKGSEEISGALVVPLLTPAGCAGVLALELASGREQTTSTVAVATIFAALLVQLISRADSAEIRPEDETGVPAMRNCTPPILRVRR